MVVNWKELHHLFIVDRGTQLGLGDVGSVMLQSQEVPLLGLKLKLLLSYRNSVALSSGQSVVLVKNSVVESSVVEVALKASTALRVGIEQYWQVVVVLEVVV